jgi:hypothetical protein
MIAFRRFRNRIPPCAAYLAVVLVFFWSGCGGKTIYNATPNPTADTLLTDGSILPNDTGVSGDGPADSVSTLDGPKSGTECAESENECATGKACISGFCLDPCSMKASALTGLGCRYVAVDLENVGETGDGGGALNSADTNFAVLVVNRSDVEPLSIRVRESIGGEDMPNLSYDLPPGGSQVLPVGVRNFSGTSKGMYAYELVGNVPFAAYQLNPLDPTGRTVSNDMSRLLPLTDASTEFIAVTGPYYGFVTVVGVLPGTQVSVRPSGPVAGGGGVLPLESGKLYTVDLLPGEILNLRGATFDVDLTGTEVWSTEPVAVFSGSVLSRTSTACCADHLEQQTAPVDTWGTTYVAARSRVRGKAPDYWRAIAAHSTTTVTFDPPVHVPVELKRGEWVQFEANEGFVAEADGPFKLVQILASSHEVTVDGTYCTSDLQCDDGQTCVGATANAAGRCYSTCKIEQDDCPSPVYSCHDRSGDLPGYSSGQGLCYRNACGGDFAPCTVGTTCVQGESAAVCYEVCLENLLCSEPGAACGLLGGQAICDPPQCNETVPCPEGATCVTLPSGNTACQWGCAASNDCPIDGYRCLSSALYKSEAKWFSGDICVPPVCSNDSDCPLGHLCSVSFGADPPFTCKPIGDPALIELASVEQFRTDHVVVMPKGFTYHYVTIAAPASAAVKLDGTPIALSHYKALGTSYKTATLKVTDGLHRVTANLPISVVAYGFGDEVSYGTRAGGSLISLVDQGSVVGPGDDVISTDVPSDTIVHDGGDGKTDVPTWNGDIRPMLTVYCVPCHIGGGSSGDVTFDNYAAVFLPSKSCPDVNLGVAAVMRIKDDPACEGEVMPPTGPAPSLAEIEVLDAWIAAGMPEG